MRLAVSTASSTASLGFLLCAGLCLLFGLSAIGLAAVLIRNGRRQKSDEQPHEQP